MWTAGAMAFGETFFAPSSYGEALDAAELSRALGRIRALGGSCHDPRGRDCPGRGYRSCRHDALRSPERERDAVIAVQACNPDGCRLHFCHMSTAEAIDVANGTVEVTPHHLFLSREKTSAADSRFKVNPPIRSENGTKSALDALGQDRYRSHPITPPIPWRKSAPVSKCAFRSPGRGDHGTPAHGRSARPEDHPDRPDPEDRDRTCRSHRHPPGRICTR